jgi:ABC-2 type transport system permease protein
MPTSKVLIVAKRDYLSRVRTPGFWIATVAIPVLMAAWIVLPSLIMSKSRGGLHLAIVDQTGKVAPGLEREMSAREKKEPDDDGPKVDLRLETLAPSPDAAAQRAELDARVLRNELDGWLWIPPAVFADNKAEYHGATLSNIITLQILERAMTRVLREQRLTADGYDPAQVEKLVASVDLDRVRVTQQGSRRGQGLGDFFLAIGLFMMLYTTVMIYGQMVMQGVLEEKSNRIVEVIASSARPTQLMAGKMLGICGVALTQIAVWLVSVAIFTAPRLLAAMGAAAGATQLPSLAPGVIVHFFALFLLGFVFYASFFALVGAAFNNPQEAQQLVSVATIFLAAPFFFFMPVLNDPDSRLAVVTSLIPLFTPTVMMLRIAIKMPPAWQLALGYVGATLADLAMVWLCARVYRVGILMYGKRPSLKEIWRWTRYA